MSESVTAYYVQLYGPESKGSGTRGSLLPTRTFVFWVPNGSRLVGHAMFLESLRGLGVLGVVSDSPWRIMLIGDRPHQVLVRAFETYEEFHEASGVINQHARHYCG